MNTSHCLLPQACLAACGATENVLATYGLRLSENFRPSLSRQIARLVVPLAGPASPRMESMQDELAMRALHNVQEKHGEPAIQAARVCCDMFRLAGYAFIEENPAALVALILDNLM